MSGTVGERPVTTPAFTYTGEELDALAGADNYHRWIARRFAPYLGGRIVEAGAGIGTFAAALRRVAPTSALTLVEPASNNYPHLALRHGGDPRCRTVHGYLADAGADGGADTVVAVNVLEHVEDDREFLRTAHRLLVPGGHLLIHVPAMPSLYGTLDEAFEHHRRYARSELGERLRAAGFEVLKLSYSNLPGIAAWWFTGRVLRRRTLGSRATLLYDRVMIPLIAAAERIASPPLGQSLIAIARRAAPADPR
jgi:SAM-dependent methyltransferase